MYEDTEEVRWNPNLLPPVSLVSVREHAEDRYGSGAGIGRSWVAPDSEPCRCENVVPAMQAGVPICGACGGVR